MLRNVLLRTPRYVVFAIWGAGIVAALYSLQQYNSLPAGTVICKVHHSLTGQPAPPASPSASFRLVMYVHPHCPCTRASFQELNGIIDHARNSGKELTVKIVVVVAPGMPDGWSEGPNVRAARQIEGAEVIYDRGGHRAREAGATTSGKVVLYYDSRRVFEGGITRSRGHGGENDGTRAVIGRLHGHEPHFRYTPVFGCPLFDAETCASIEACSASGAPKSVSQDSVPLTPGPSPARGEGSQSGH